MVLAARVEAAAGLDAEAGDRVVRPSGRRARPGAQLRREAARRRDAELARVGPGAGRHVAQGAGPGLAQPGRRQVAVQVRQIGLADPAQRDVLFHRRTHRVADVAAGNRCQLAHLPAAQVAERQGDRRHRVAGLALAVDVGPHPVGEPGRSSVAVQRRRRLQRLLAVRRRRREVRSPARIVGQPGALLQDQPPELVQPELGDQELDARPGAILLLAQPREHARDRLRQRQELFLRQEFVEQLGLVGHRAQPAPDVGDEPAAQLPVDGAGGRHQAQVVHRYQPARVLAAARERHLELAAEVLRVGMAQQEAHAGVRVRRDVERLVTADPGERARRHVPHRVAAGLARGDADGRQAPHEVGRVVDVHEVELDVLARRDVADLVAVLLGKVGQRVHLIRIEAAERNLDARHARRVPDRLRALGHAVCRVRQRARAGAVVAAAVVVPLAVDAAPETRLGKDLLVDLALAAQGDLALERLDLGGEIRRHAVGQLLFPGHVTPASSFH